MPVPLPTGIACDAQRTRIPSWRRLEPRRQGLGGLGEGPGVCPGEELQAVFGFRRAIGIGLAVEVLFLRTAGGARLQQLVHRVAPAGGSAMEDRGTR
jgi:hypothetical protein